MSEETKDQIIARLRDRITDLEAACLAATYIDDFEAVREMLQVAYGKSDPISPGAAAIVRERMRQIEDEGWSDQHDDEHEVGELAWAAVAYAAPERIVRYDAYGFEHDVWPWSPGWDKRGKHPRLRQLEIAGALIAAEIDRLQRAQAREASA